MKAIQLQNDLCKKNVKNNSKSPEQAKEKEFNASFLDSESDDIDKNYRTQKIFILVSLMVH